MLSFYFLAHSVWAHRQKRGGRTHAWLVPAGAAVHHMLSTRREALLTVENQPHNCRNHFSCGPCGLIPFNLQQVFINLFQAQGDSQSLEQKGFFHIPEISVTGTAHWYKPGSTPLMFQGSGGCEAWFFLTTHISQSLPSNTVPLLAAFLPNETPDLNTIFNPCTEAH